MSASPARILREFKKSLDESLKPSVLNANPSQGRRKRLPSVPSLIDEDIIKIYAFPNHQFQLNYFSNTPMHIHDAYEIEYITITVQPFFTFGGGNFPNKISIMVQVFLKDTQGDDQRLIKNVLLNHVVSTEEGESVVNIFYDSTIPIHDKTKPYEGLKVLLIKLWMDTRTFLHNKGLHGTPGTPIYETLRSYINALPVPEKKRNDLVYRLFNADASKFPFKIDKMILRDFAQTKVGVEDYINFMEFLLYKDDGTTGGRAGRAKRTRSAPSAKAKVPAAPPAKAKAKAKAKSKNL